MGGDGELGSPTNYSTSRTAGSRSDWRSGPRTEAYSLGSVDTLLARGQRSRGATAAHRPPAPRSLHDGRIIWQRHVRTVPRLRSSVSRGTYALGDRDQHEQYADRRSDDASDDEWERRCTTPKGSRQENGPCKRQHDPWQGPEGSRK